MRRAARAAASLAAFFAAAWLGGAAEPRRFSVTLDELSGPGRGGVAPAFQGFLMEGASFDLPPGARGAGSAAALPRVRAWGPQAPGLDAAERSPIRIAHDAVGCVVAEAHPRIQACLEPADRVGRAQVLFRSRDTEPWYRVELVPEGPCFSSLLPKPKRSLAEFRYFIEVVDRDFADSRMPAAAPAEPYRARVVPSRGECEADRRVAALLAQAAVPLIVGGGGGTVVPDGFAPEGAVGAAAAGVDASIVSTGSASGPVAQLQAANDSAEAARLWVPGGLVIVPVGSGAAAPLGARRRGRVSTETLRGYCLDFPKPPPPPGTPYRVADGATQARFRGLAALLLAARRLDAGGLLHPDSEPRAYGDSIRQWALWTRLGGWDEAAFTRAFLERTRRNVEDMRQPWTKEMEQGIRAAAPGRWRDIAAVLDAAK